MSKGTIVKTVLVMGGLCAALWQAAQFMEILSSVKGQQGSAGPRSAVGGLNLPGMPAGAGEAMKDHSGLLSQLGVSSSEVPAESKEIVVFSSSGKPLTPAELEALKREAERNRPRVPVGKQK